MITAWRSLPRRARYIVVLIVVGIAGWLVFGPDAGSIAVRAAIRAATYDLVRHALHGGH